MLGAGGEQLAVYKGVQAAHEDSSGHTGRRVYMYNESYISLGGTLVTLPDNTKQFNAMDNIGSVRLTVSVKGQDIAAEHFDYKPFGDTLNAEGESRIGYAAQERDEESRYFAMGARQYDPLSGRFLSVDPLYESFPDKTPYHYCNNNPISFKDPSGLSPEGEKGKEDEVQVVYYLDFSWCYEMMEKTQARMEEARIAQEMFLMNFETRFELCSIRQEFYDFFSESSGGDGGGGGGGRVRLCPYGTDAERKVLADALGEITNTNIIYDENGVITSIEMRSGPPRHQNQVWAAKRLAGFMKNVKESGKDFDIFFADHDLLEDEIGTGVYWSTTKEYAFGKLKNPSLVISREVFFNGDELAKYAFLAGDNFWSRFDCGYKNQSIYGMLGHELFGHAYQRYQIGKANFKLIGSNAKESYAIITENFIHDIFNEPYRIRFDDCNNCYGYCNSPDISFGPFINMYFKKK